MGGGQDNKAYKEHGARSPVLSDTSTIQFAKKYLEVADFEVNKLTDTFPDNLVVFINKPKD